MSVRSVGRQIESVCVNKALHESDSWPKALRRSLC